ncbi:MAG: hypothetical protein NTV00_05750 [Methylococcales bacterium]|nr:hypothetical protein [Methylococcales bacterium]
MKKFPLIKTTVFAGLLSLAAMLALTGCSDDNDKKTAAKEETISHELLNVKVTDEEKQKFEHDFESQCIAREAKNAVDPEEAKVRFTEPCRCIATYMMKDLTAIEAEKFLTEHEDAQSLRIKYENAAYHCLQQKTHPNGPNFSKPQ